MIKNSRRKTLLFIFMFILLFVMIASLYGCNNTFLKPDDPAGKDIYYTRINNDDVKKNEDERHEYNLISYDKDGNEKKLKFTTARQLREHAYIKLYVATFRGVTNWQEVQLDDLPGKVQEKYK
ncbi:YxeA family protein [Aneurinibacillus aneurinilyticus]|uniref:YxeA family protein n=1 Tax=Aneurinibacillus aneurinilyticus TaxID=1391 RepID=UPI0035251BD6